MFLRTLVPAVFVVGAVTCVTGVYVWETVRVPGPSIQPAENKGAADSTKALKLYHGAALQAFQLTPGFGKGRMITLEREIEEIYVRWSPGDLDSDGAPIEVPELAKSHRERAGLLAIDSKPEFITINVEALTVQSIHADGPAQRWRLQRVDLVALIDHEQPVVYLTPKEHRDNVHGGHSAKPEKKKDALPQQEPAADSRPPDLLEIAALEKLRHGEELFVRSKDDALRVVGALRATKACLKCHHDSKEGDLFGAFSYTLKKANP